MYLPLNISWWPETKLSNFPKDKDQIAVSSIRLSNINNMALPWIIIKGKTLLESLLYQLYSQTASVRTISKHHLVTRKPKLQFINTVININNMPLPWSIIENFRSKTFLESFLYHVHAQPWLLLKRS